MLRPDGEPQLQAPTRRPCQDWDDIERAYTAARKLRDEVARRHGGWLRRLATRLRLQRPDPMAGLLQEDADYLIQVTIPRMRNEFADHIFKARQARRRP